MSEFRRSLAAASRLLVLGVALTAPALAESAKDVPAAPVSLVAPETIAAQNELTDVFRLRNDIPVIYRQIPGSDILEVVVTFDFGLKDLAHGRKAHGNLLFSTMGMAARGYTKTRVFRLTEQYALELGCISGIEVSHCALGTINQHYSQSLPLFAAIVKEPTLSDTDLKLTSERLAAQQRRTFQDPSRFVNEVVNRVYYDKTHPYHHPYDQALEELENYKRQDLIQLHKGLLNASRMQITVVGNMDRRTLERDLNQHFGGIEASEHERVMVSSPSYSRDENYAFEQRDIPTAYVRLKFDGVPMGDPDEDAVNLMINILNEELSEEIRTRQSLSYAVYSFMLQYSVGVGVVSASTSKPKETITAMQQVIERMKSRRLTNEELAEFTPVYTTRYFLTQETHASLASAIAGTYFYRGSVDHLYQLPNRLGAITPGDIQRAARRVLQNMRVGVVFDKKEFDDSWARSLTRAFEAPQPHEQKAAPID